MHQTSCNLQEFDGHALHLLTSLLTEQAPIAQCLVYFATRKTTSRRLGICSAHLRKSEHRWVFSLTSLETAFDVRARYRYRQLLTVVMVLLIVRLQFPRPQRVALPTCPVPACECTTGSTCDDKLHEAQRGQHRSRRGRKTVVRSLRRAAACRSDFLIQLLSVNNVSGSESDIDLSSALWHWHESQSSLANLAGSTEASRVSLCISQSSTRSHKTFKHGKTSRYIHFVYVVMVTTGPQRNRLVLRLVPGLSLPTNTVWLRRSLSTQKITSCLV